MGTKRILVVDDDAELLSILKVSLAFDPSYEVITCSDPLLALEKVISENFDLVLADFHMPVLNGGELLESIKVKKPQLPVFLFSIYYDDQAIPPAVREKADAIVPKPIEHEKLKDLIQKKIG